MWRSGAARRRGHAALARMVAEAERAGRFTAPWCQSPEVLTHYPTAGAILVELSRQWRTALAGAVYLAVEAGDGDLVADVTRAYDEVSRRHSGVRRILDAHAEHPAIAAAVRKERRLLQALTVEPPGPEPVASLGTAA